MASRIVVLVVILAAGVTGFEILDLQKAILWLVFCIAAYPVVNAFTIAGPMPSSDLLALYKIGVSQIPLIGRFVGSPMSQARGTDSESATATQPGVDEDPAQAQTKPREAATGEKK
jgi:hypothetical protein